MTFNLEDIKNYNWHEKTALLYKVAQETYSLHWMMEVCRKYAQVCNISYTEASDKLEEIFKSMEER